MQETNVTGRTKFQPLWITILRMILGFILAWKGLVFIRDTTLLEVLIGRTGIGVFSRNTNILSFIVSYLSLLCGLFIGSGLWTRAFSIVQIPVLIIAVFFVNLNNVDTSQFELILSIITLILLVLFAIKGSGTISADEFFRTYYKAGTEDGQTKRFFKS